MREKFLCLLVEKNISSLVVQIKSFKNYTIELESYSKYKHKELVKENINQNN